MRNILRDVLIVLGLVALGMGLLALAGCASAPEAGGATTKVGVAEAPCDPAKAPRPRPLPADALTGAEDLFTWGATMWADYLARRAYQRELEAFVRECTAAPGAPGAALPGRAPEPAPAPGMRRQALAVRHVPGTGCGEHAAAPFPSACPGASGSGTGKSTWATVEAMALRRSRV